MSEHPPRFLYDTGFMRALVAIDSSYAECSVDGRLAVYVDYRRGIPQSVQVIRMPPSLSFKIHTAGS